MASNSNCHDISTGLLDPGEIQEGWNSNGDGTNAILLTRRCKSKTEDFGKASKKSKIKIKQPPTMRNTKLKKLKRLQEENEKKLRLSESIKILEKYRLSDAAYSLLHSSGTIGQTDTAREKRRRAVYLSRAGLEVPEDAPPPKKRGEFRGVSEIELDSRVDSDQCHLEQVSLGNNISLAKCTKRDDCNQDNIVESHLKPASKSPTDVKSLPVTEAEEKDTNTCMVDEQKKPASISFSSAKREDANYKRSGDQGDSGSDISCKTMKAPVHVSRPKEVEESRKDLPIIMMEQEIMEAINEHSIVILCGETGCGKTTQVPQFLYEDGFGSRSDRKGIIGVTQPRRVAVLATARRVSLELGLRLGKEVGFQVRHDKVMGDGCTIKFMTDGILLREVQSDFLLRRYSVIILDEAHERSLNTDILVGMLSRVIKLRKEVYAAQQDNMSLGVRVDPETVVSPLKLVLMSATLRVEDFLSDRNLFHEPPPVLEVPVRQFPVTTHFLKRTPEDYLGQAYKKVMSIHRKLPEGGILVFVTGQREVEFLCEKLRRASPQRKEDKEITAGSEMDMKDINEAFEAGTSSGDDEDHDIPNIDESYLSDSESESEPEVDGIDEKAGPVLDFLRNPESLSSLKASFKALAGEKGSHPAAPAIEDFSKSTPRSPVGLYVLPLYAMLPASAQLRVFKEVPEGERLVVVATNVAETSLTIPGIKYVVDTGKEKVKNYNYATGMATYEVQWISKASGAQRAGRSGRTGPGHCYRLYSSAAFSKDDVFPQFSHPEISKIPVDDVVLLLKSMGIGEVSKFPFPTRPEHQAVAEAEKCLKALEALDREGGRITPLGRAMAQYPMSPRHSRMLLTAIQLIRSSQGHGRVNLVLGYAVSAAAALSFPNPFIMQFGGDHRAADNKDQLEQQRRMKKKKAIAREARARFSNPSSDALTITNALHLFELSENPTEFCGANSLHYKTMEEMSKLRKQLLQLVFRQDKQCPEFTWNGGSFADVELSWRNPNEQPLKLHEEEILGQAICAGWADRAAKRVRTVSEAHAVRYQSCVLDDAVYLPRQSSVSRSAPEFVVYTELLQSKRPYMHGATQVQPEWLIKYASSLCTFSGPLDDPKPCYEPVSDRVLCWYSPTFNPHGWQLPLHRMPIKEKERRVCVFACALLEGRVLPCLGAAQGFLAGPPSSILRPEALGQRRVGDLVSRLKSGTRTIDSRGRLREAWSLDPHFLYLEIKSWFQKSFHEQFSGVWEQMHLEVLKEAIELFPKRKKTGRKKVKC